MNPLEARALFERLLSAPDDQLDPVQVGFAIAAEEYPALDPARPLAALERLARRVGRTLGPGATASERLVRLDTLFFRELGFDGAGCDFNDPESSFLHSVLERRRGLPIALSVLYVHLGRRLGLSCHGVAFPGHFLARVENEEGVLLVDPFHRGRLLEEAELDRRLREATAGRQRLEPWMVRAASPRAVVARMLRNLKGVYLRRRDLPRALAAVDRLLVATPDSADDVRDRAILCDKLGGHAAARRDFERYLALAPDAADAPDVRARLRALPSAPPLLN